MKWPFRRWRDLSLRTKLFTIYLATTGLALLTLMVLHEVNHYRSQREMLIEELRVQARVFAENSSAALVFDDRQAAAETLAALRASPDVFRAVLSAADGTPFASYRREGGERFAKGGAWGGTVSVNHPVMHSNHQVGSIFIESGLDRLHARFIRFSFITAILTALALLLAYQLIRRLNRAVTDPICSLSQIMEEVTQYQNYSLRSEVKGADEVGQLARIFNHMLEQIQQRDNDLARELGERKHAEVQLDQLAHIDPVTGLANRNAFNERVQEVLERACREGGRSAALIFLDLDNFKMVNDTLGHDVGDLLLKVVSERLAHTVRLGSLVSRIGGDEFAIVMEGIAEQSRAERMAERILHALADPLHLKGQRLHVTCSAGISLCPDHARDVHEWLKCADTAMYAAKKRGKNSYRLFHPGMKEENERRMTLENSLHRALENGEFELHYQPQVELLSGRVMGAEALLRWRHPKSGLVSPAEFITVAEESGLIIPIGEWVLREACLEAKRWHEAGFGHLRVAVNVSGRQFVEDEWGQGVLDALAETGLPARALELELTESILMDASEKIIAKLDRLRRAGVRFSVDDFGTGYSSLSYLKSFPVDMLKVDRSFVKELPGAEDDAAITGAIIAMARSLRLETIAEGVENAGQLEYLRASGCTLIQGYFFSNPLPAAEFMALLKTSAGTISRNPTP